MGEARKTADGAGGGVGGLVTIALAALWIRGFGSLVGRLRAAM